MPVGDYEWMTPEEMSQHDWSNYDWNSSTGYIVECDLTYPPELHHAHNSFPLAPTKEKIDETRLSQYSLNALHIIKNEKRHRSEKLVTTFTPKKNYVLHAVNLALYLQLGMKLDKIHRVIKFRQASFLDPHIKSCTEKRAASKTVFRKNLYKAMSNIVYGKLIERVRDYMDCKIVMDRESFMEQVSCSRFKSFKVLKPGIVVVFLERRFFKMRQLPQAGFSVLEFSKHLMYNQYYNVIRPLLGNKCSVLGTDTDSFFLLVETGESRYKTYLRLLPVLDTSNFPKDHPLFSEKLKAQPGYWKCESSGKKILRFVGLSSKCYSMEVESGEDGNTREKTKCKGVVSAYSRKLGVDDFRTCLDVMKSQAVTQYTIQARDHVIRTMKSNKIAFSSFDDKRFYTCAIHTVPYGSIFASNNQCVFCDGIINLQ